MAKILNIGSINIDHVYSVPHFVKASETLASNAKQLFPGGKGLNQSVALALAGADVYHAGMIGNDGFQMAELLKSKGVDTTLIKETETPTGHAIIQVTPDGQNCILLYPGANNKLDEAFIDIALNSIGKGDIIVLQNEVSCIPYAMTKAYEMGIDIAFNPSPMSPAVFDYPLNFVRWFVINEIEGQALTQKDEPTDILNEMAKKYHDSTIVLTVGEDGALCREKGETYTHGIYSVPIVDTTAAGDTFTGYFISSIAAGSAIEEALKLASMAAALSVSKQGAAVSIPTIEEVKSVFSPYNEQKENK